MPRQAYVQMARHQFSEEVQKMSHPDDRNPADDVKADGDLPSSKKPLNQYQLGLIRLLARQAVKEHLAEQAKKQSTET